MHLTGDTDVYSKKGRVCQLRAVEHALRHVIIHCGHVLGTNGFLKSCLIPPEHIVLVAGVLDEFL